MGSEMEAAPKLSRRSARILHSKILPKVSSDEARIVTVAVYVSGKTSRTFPREIFGPRSVMIFPGFFNFLACGVILYVFS